MASQNISIVAVLVWLFVIADDGEAWSHHQKRPVQTLDSFDLSASWGESVVVKEADVEFDKGSFVVVRLESESENKKIYTLSKPAFQRWLRLSKLSMDEKRRILEDESSNFAESLLQLLAHEFGEAALEGKCSGKQITNTLIQQLLLLGLDGPKSQDPYTRYNTLRKLYEERLLSKEICTSLIGPWLFFVGANPLTFYETDTGWVPAGLLQAYAEKHCMPNGFSVGIRSIATYECIRGIDSDFPQNLSAKHLAFPALLLARSISESNHPNKQGLTAKYFTRMSRSGFYFPDLPLIYPNRSTDSQILISLFLDQSFVGKFRIPDLNPYLVDSVGIGKCRKLITGSGVQEYCLKPVDHAPRAATNEME